MKNQARYDKATALMEGIFRPIAKNQVKALKKLAAVEYPACTYPAKEEDGRVIAKGFTITIRTPATVGVQHETLLLTLLKMAVRETMLTKESNKELQLKFEDLAKERLLVRTSYAELMRELGLEWSTDTKERIRGYIEDFVSSTVKVEYHLTNARVMDNILGYAENIGGAELSIAINARMTACFLGEKSCGYATINLDERRTLESDIAKSLHRWLSTNLYRKGFEQTYTYNTLAVKVWGVELDKGTADTKRKRMDYISDALRQIDKLEKWSCALVPADKRVVIKRVK